MILINRDDIFLNSLTEVEDARCAKRAYIYLAKIR